MTFSGCGSYRKETCDSDEYKVTVYNIYVLDKLDGIMTAFEF